MPAQRWRGLLGIALIAAAGGCRDPTLREPVSSPYLLVEKGPYQSLYDEAGRLERLVYDQDGDRTADAVILYGPDGQLRQAEIDTDLDRVIDRWEYFEKGLLVRLEYDDDGDGRVDRSEPVN